jgi:hypothetical protein
MGVAVTFGAIGSGVPAGSAGIGFWAGMFSGKTKDSKRTRRSARIFMAVPYRVKDIVFYDRPTGGDTLATLF